MALYNEDSALAENTIRFLPGILIQIYDRFVILAFCLSARPVVAVVFLKRFMRLMSRSSWGVHVRWVKNDAIDLPIIVRELSAIHSVLNIRGTDII